MQKPQSEIINHSLSAPGKLNSDLLKIALLLFVGAVILFINIGGWDLWNPDEPRYAQVAREMLQTGNYLVPHINGGLYPDKPPVFFWLIALASKPFGDVTAASARIPSAIAALCVILLTYLFGRKLYNPTVGFLAGLILLSTTQFIWLAMRANIDMTLTLWTTLSLFFLYCGYTRETGKGIWYLLSYVSMGLAVLTKGPVGFLIPLITIIVYILCAQQYHRVKELHLLTGILMIAGIAALWLVPACISGGNEYTQNILFHQTFGRAVDSYSHHQPFYYYLINFPADFNPWTFFIPSAVIYFWGKKKSGAPLNIQFPLVWFLGTFIFFSFISGKRNLYLLPLYPAAALLMANFWYNFVAAKKAPVDEQLPRLLSVPLYLLFTGLVIFCLGFSAFITFGSKLEIMKEIEVDISKTSFIPVLSLLCAGGIAGLVLLKTGARAVMSFAVIIIIMISAFLFSAVSFFPSMNTFKSGKPFCDRIAKIVKPTDKLITFRFNPESFNYFLNRVPIPVINEYEKLKKLLASPDKVYCLIHSYYLEQAPEDEQKMVTVLDESQIGHRKYYLLVNQASRAQ